MKKILLCPLTLCLCMLVIAPASAGPPSSFIKGPYLQNPQTNAVTVMWETKKASDSTVEYGIDPSLGLVKSVPEQVLVHEVSLGNLQSSATYYYRIRSGKSISPINIFTTAPDPASEELVRVVAYGDSRSHPEIHKSVVNGIMDAYPDLVLHVGDYVLNGTLYEEWGVQFFDPAADLMVNTPIFTTLGNHEYNSHWYYDFFALPGGEQWYATTYGAMRIICLDTNTYFYPGREQYEWLVSELQSPECQDAPWRIVFFHDPVYSSGEYGGNPAVQGHLVPLFEEYGVDVVLNGDCHSYERSFKDGVAYVVTAGGGAPLYPVNITENPYQRYAASVHHYCVLDVTPSKIRIEARTPDGDVFDSTRLPQVHDVSIKSIKTLPWTRTNDTLSVEVLVGNPGGFEENNVEVTLRNLTTDVIIGTDFIGSMAPESHQEVSFAWSPDDTGEFRLEAKVSAVPGEAPADMVNNAAAADVKVVSAGAREHTAIQDIPVEGDVAGSYLDTSAKDADHESITEIVTKGKPSKRLSYLEHRWQLEVSPGAETTLFLKAHREAEDAGDTFSFAYSTDNQTFAHMLTVSQTSENGDYLRYDLPPGLSGSLYVRVQDDDRTKGNGLADAVHVDHMVILSD
ncbi:metallophosphoesterase [Acidobacteriota bacterium]